jgi:hypothetical protein
MSGSALTALSNDEMSELQAEVFRIGDHCISPGVTHWVYAVVDALHSERWRRLNNEPPEPDEPLAAIDSKHTSEDDLLWLGSQVQLRRDDTDFSDGIREVWNVLLGALSDELKRRPRAAGAI